MTSKLPCIYLLPELCHWAEDFLCLGTPPTGALTAAVQYRWRESRAQPAARSHRALSAELRQTRWLQSLERTRPSAGWIPLRPGWAGRASAPFLQQVPCHALVPRAPRGFFYSIGRACCCCSWPRLGLLSRSRASCRLPAGLSTPPRFPSSGPHTFLVRCAGALRRWSCQHRSCLPQCLRASVGYTTF